MTWIHASTLVVCIVAVIACGFHPGCVAVLPQMITLVSAIAGGVLGNAQSGAKEKSTK